MSFAIVQSELTPPTLDQLRQALTAALPAGGRFVPADASGILNDSFGILMDKLTFEQAQATKLALADVDYAVEVVDHDELFDLPASKGTNRLVPTNETLIVSDVLGRESFVPWDSVLVIAAGYVGKVRMKQTVERIGYDSHGFPMDFVRTQELKGFDPTLELLLEVEPMRLRIDGQRFHYGYLADRMTNNAEINFLLVVQDIAKHATHAVLNAGTQSIISESNDVAVYPMRRCFDEELVWQVWRSMHGA